MKCFLLLCTQCCAPISKCLGQKYILNTCSDSKKCFLSNGTVMRESVLNKRHDYLLAEKLFQLSCYFNSSCSSFTNSIPKDICVQITAQSLSYRFCLLKITVEDV